MMKKHLFLASAVALALLTGCNNNEYEGMDIPGSELQVRAGINEMSRLSDTGMEWTVGDAIGVSQSGADATDLNIKYTATSTQGAFSSTTGIFVKGDGNVTYTAYYPYSGEEGKSAGTISFDLTKKGNYDFMFAEATASREKPEADFKFEHKMSRVALTITETPAKEEEDSEKAASRAGEDEITVTLRGVVVDGTFDTETGEVTPGKTTGDISVTGTLGEKVYFILPAFEKANTDPIELVITKGDQAYGGTFTPGLESSTEYQYTVDLKETTGAMKVSGEIISGWTPKEEGPVAVAPKVTIKVGDFYLADGTIVPSAKLTDEQISNVRGVVFYVGNPQPSVLYAGTEGYEAENDLLRTDFPNCTNGLALSVAPDAGSHFCDKDLTSTGLMNTWFMNQSEIKGIYSARYAWDTENNAVGSSGTNNNAQNNFLGYNNTKLWRAFAEAKSIEITALTTLDAFAEENKLPTGTSGWYIPSLGEMQTLVVGDGGDPEAFAVVDALKTSFTKLGVTELFQESRYWTSTEGRINGSNAQTMSITFYKNDVYQNSFSATTNSSTGWFHYAFAF